MKSKLTIKPLLMMVITLLSFSAINAQQRMGNKKIPTKPIIVFNPQQQIDITSVEAYTSAVPCATVEYYVPDAPFDLYYWRVQGGVFSNGSNTITTTSNSTTVTWSCNCSDLNNNLAMLQVADNPYNTQPLYHTFTNQNNDCVESCDDFQVQIDAILTNNNLSALEQVIQVQNIVNNNPNCDFTICN